MALEKRVDRIEWWRDLTDTRLKEGAASFGRIRMAVWGSAAAALISVSTMIWNTATRAEQQRQAQEQLVELKKEMEIADKDREALRLKLEGHTAELRAESERRAALEETVRQAATATRRGR